jgi:hypothetical protein
LDINGLRLAGFHSKHIDRFLSSQKKPGGFEMNFSTLAGYVHTVQFNANATLPSGWSALAATNGTGNTMTIVDNAATNSSRFYRLLTTPAP